MRIGTLDHVNIRTANLAGMIAWYGDILDMHPGRRPDFSFAGAWLYAGGKPVIHLVEVAAAPRGVEPRIEHFALSATGMADFVAKLKSRGIRHSLNPVPGFPVVQVNLADPDSNHIHVDFSAEDAEGLL